MTDNEFNPGQKIKIKTDKLNLYYASFHALGDITMDIYDRCITAIIGPSGCGKSTLLRVFNRMNDLIPSVRVEGTVKLEQLEIYGRDTDVVLLRQKIGMVFQRPNVFPMSIYNNIAIGPRKHGIKKTRVLDDIVQNSLEKAALWDEVKDNLKKPALDLSPGEQQRLCIARAIAVEPEVILMDESCSALDPESTMKIEELMLDLMKNYSIIIVTHNMEQALRVSNMSAFLMIGDDRIGKLVEYGPTKELFMSPKDKRTEDYITGRFG